MSNKSNNEDDEDQEGNKYYDFETRININQACVAVMREANKMISLVKHSVAYKEVLIHREDDMQRKIESMINQNKALIEQNDQLTQKLVKTRKELNEHKNKFTAIRAIQAIGGGDFDFLKSQIERINESKQDENSSVEQNYSSQQQWRVTKQLDFQQNSNKQSSKDSFIKISQQNGKPVKLYPLSTSSPKKYTNKNRNYIAATSQSFSEQSQDQNIHTKPKQVQQHYPQNSKFGLLQTNLILQLNQIYQNKLNSMINKIESIISQISFFTRISTKKKVDYTSTHTSEGIAKKIVDLGSSHTSFESGALSDGGQDDYIAKEQIDNDIQILQNSSGEHHTIVLDQPLRSSIQLTIRRIIQVRKMTEHQFEILKDQLHNRILSQNDSKHLERYKHRIESLKNELFNSKEIMQEARKQINQLAFGKAAILTGMSKPEDDQKQREEIINVLDENIQNIENKIRLENSQNEMKMKIQQEFAQEKPQLMLQNLDYQQQHQQQPFEFPHFPTSEQILQQNTSSAIYQDENNLQQPNSGREIQTPNVLDGTLQSSALQSIDRADTVVLKNQYDRLRQKYIQLNIQYTKLHSALTSPSGGIQQLKSPRIFNTSSSQIPNNNNYLSIALSNNEQILEDINQNEEKSVQRLAKQNEQLRYLLQSNAEQIQFQKNQWERIMMEKRDQYLKDVRIQKEQIRYLKQELESYQHNSNDFVQN